MKPPRDRTVVHVRDLSEQPEGTLILVIGGAIRNYVSVDRIVIEDGAVKGLRLRPGGVYAPIAMCPAHGSWGVMHRDLLDMPTVAESLKAQLDDGAAMVALAGELGMATEEDAPPTASSDYAGAGPHTYL